MNGIDGLFDHGIGNDAVFVQMSCYRSTNHRPNKEVHDVCCRRVAVGLRRLRKWCAATAVVGLLQYSFPQKAEGCCAHRVSYILASSPRLRQKSTQDRYIGS